MLPFLRASASAKATSPARRAILRGLATLAQEVRSDESFHIPVVSFNKWREATSESEKKATADEVVTAFREVGFVYLRGHGIGPGVVDTAFKQSAKFFSQPTEDKAKLAWEDPRSNRGYVQPGRERVTQSSDATEIAALRAKAPDYKESMEIGRDWDATWRNQWPVEAAVPGFKSTMLDFFQRCHNLHVEVMSSIALGLGLKEKFFDSLIQEQYHNLRLLNYPSIPRELLQVEGTSRAGAHSDYGSLTFVFQDAVGGLEVQNPHTRNWHPATPIPDTIVVNVGDLLARWSNDTLRSTLHRVVAPRISDGATMTPSRQSMAFFCNPNGTATIECLPTCVGHGARYPAVQTEKYIVGRLTDTYA
ncbi:Clavaminate synthase-like protein [Auriculariales sp. MPI-PUGE-AT-0066]|nr:Clavaminate synthase-like protein [Auriculariales sp. MPI-PUGE-AT-0066]